MQNWLRSSRQQIDRDLAQSLHRRYFSAAFLAQYKAVLPAIDRHVRGKVIDLGCGTMPFRETLSDKAEVYHTLELRPTSEETTYVGDIQDMHMIENGLYDSILCLEVLEHIPSPCMALREMHRILAPGGMVILSVPHLSRLHEEPYDFYRYTTHGLHYLLEEHGFEVLEIREKGGLFSFLGHQISTICLGMVWPVPGMRQLIWFLNKWLITLPSYGLDQIVDRSGIFALGYVGIARKTSEG
ncbi:MAG: methyltransferase domain-containing protein [Anaerolineae bacterium]|nr:methyltransferase domain-containing protein [Anaerolineae bacterium]